MNKPNERKEAMNKPTEKRKLGRAVVCPAQCVCPARGYWFRCKCGQAICNNCGAHYDDSPSVCSAPRPADETTE
jgi:hypothetical protein